LEGVGSLVAEGFLEGVGAVIAANGFWSKAHGEAPAFAIGEREEEVLEASCTCDGATGASLEGRLAAIATKVYLRAPKVCAMSGLVR
jgi:hypothetical protein